MKNKPSPTTQGSSVSLRSTPSAKQRRQQSRKANKQRKSEDVLVRNNKPKPPSFKFKDTTIDFGEEPETLEIHPTQSAPTVAEIEDELAREQEKERLRFFNIPIKIYDPNEDETDTDTDTSSKIELLKIDRAELHRYGSRVLMSTEGHVMGLEVRQDLIKETKRKNITTEICQCIEREYAVCEVLKNNNELRRRFMAHVLFVEAAFRIPSIFFYLIQYNYEGLHDFLYQQNLLTFFIICIIEGTRVASINFSDIGRFEPCLTIITGLTITGHCLLLTLLTAIMESFQMLFIQYDQFEDPTSLVVVNIKKKTTDCSYPYCFCLGTIHQVVSNCILGSILMLSRKRKTELGNGFFMLVLTVTTVIWIGISLLVIFSVGSLLGIRRATAWDVVQVVSASVCVCKWSMWRFFMLQELLRGRVMEVKEGYHHFVALSFAL